MSNIDEKLKEVFAHFEVHENGRPAPYDLRTSKERVIDAVKKAAGIES